MVRTVSIVALAALLVGISSAAPQARLYRQAEEVAVETETDAPAETDSNAVDVADVAVTLSPRSASPDTDAAEDAEESNALGLPSNASSIRARILDSFSCEGRVYGYYADVDNECQIFHVCLPVVNAGRREQTFKWSFICPGETIFNQESFTCTRPEDSVPCEESPQFYSLNDNFGVTGKSDNDVIASRSGDAAIDAEVSGNVAAVEDVALATADEASSPPTDVEVTTTATLAAEES